MGNEIQDQQVRDLLQSIATSLETLAKTAQELMDRRKRLSEKGKKFTKALENLKNKLEKQKTDIINPFDEPEKSKQTSTTQTYKGPDWLNQDELNYGGPQVGIAIIDGKDYPAAVTFELVKDEITHEDINKAVDAENLKCLNTLIGKKPNFEKQKYDLGMTIKESEMQQIDGKDVKVITDMEIDHLSVSLPDKVDKIIKKVDESIEKGFTIPINNPVPSIPFRTEHLLPNLEDLAIQTEKEHNDFIAAGSEIGHKNVLKLDDENTTDKPLAIQPDGRVLVEQLEHFPLPSELEFMKRDYILDLSVPIDLENLDVMEYIRVMKQRWEIFCKLWKHITDPIRIQWDDFVEINGVVSVKTLDFTIQGFSEDGLPILDDSPVEYRKLASQVVFQQISPNAGICNFLRKYFLLENEYCAKESTEILPGKTYVNGKHQRFECLLRKRVKCPECHKILNGVLNFTYGICCKGCGGVF